MKRSIKASLIATAIAMLPFGSHAAGLGSIHVFSGIGQPLRAEIELSASPEELQSMSANLAPPDAFRQANLQFSPAASSLRFAVERRGSRSVVKVSSDRPFNEPFVELLLELNWAAGRMLREYTFLLDPVPAAAPAPAVVAARPAAPSPARAATPAAPSVPRESAAASRYEVQRGDTLRRIAEANRPNGATLEQMLVALFRANPDAFDDGNVNRLRAGAILNVPGEPEVRAIDAGQARREVLAQSSNFQTYRRTLASTVASRPAASEQAPSRGGAGSIVPKVSEVARPTGGDQVKVSGGAAAPAKGNNDDSRTSRLQALEEEVAARGKALDEANSRLIALEDSIRKMQQLIELRNQALAQAQQQAAGASAPLAPQAAPAPSAVAEKPAEVPPAAPVAEPPKPLPPKAPAPVVTPPADEPTFLQSLLGNPTMLLGGGGILALLLAFAGLKMRQRRQQTAAGAGAPASEFPVETNSVFGKTGGQSVNTGESSVLHTDFSQSGLSAIDTDEGVDPVAEADVYMAYGRDAQAEEILLDALKTDAGRLAIYVKLLEIYAQRNSVKPFETTATDLYARSGGEGPEWAKAAEMGRRIDPDNPLYHGSRQAARAGAAAVAAGAAATAAMAVGTQGSAGDSDFAVTLPDETTSPAPGEIALPDDDFGASLPADEVELEALPEIDSNALDFDLDAGLGLGGATAEPATVPELQGGELEIDLDMLGGGDETSSEPPTASVESAASAQLNETVIGEGLDFAAVDQGLEFDLGAEAAQKAGESEEPEEFNLDATVVGGEENLTAAAEPLDLEKTSFDSSLLDFDFNLDEAGDSATPSELPAPAIDLSSIDLELDSPTEVNDESEVAVADELPELASAAGGISPLAGDEGIPSEVLEEVNTKLELARAYEEMGDSEGARELLEEVQREGSAEQRQAAAQLLGRLG